MMGREHDQRAFRLHVRRLFVAGALALLSLSSHAFYSSVTPPDGWSSGGGPGGQTAKAISNAQASSKFTSTVTKVPVAMRFASGAARIAARAIVGGGVVGAGVIAATWLAENCFEKRNGQWVRTCFPNGDGPKPSDGYLYRPNGWTYDPQQYWPTKDEACSIAVSWLNANAVNSSISGYSLYSCTATQVAVNRHLANGTTQTNYTAEPLVRKGGGCPAGWYQTPAGCVQDPPYPTVTPQQIEDEMAPKTVPPGLPSEIPGSPLPIELPTINPVPGNPTVPSPWKEPTGNPQPIPNTDPQKYKQPWVTIKPAPTTTDPWRVDVQPESTETTSAEPVGPDGIAGPQTNNDQKKPEEKEPDLCEKHPEIIACQKIDFDTPDGEIPKENRNVSFQEQSLFGTGQCPADVYANLGTLNGLHVKLIDWQTFCGWAVPLRALVIALAGLTACFIILPGGRTE